MSRVVRVVAVCGAGLLGIVVAGTAMRGQGFPKPTLQEGPVEVRGSVSVTNSPTVEARQSGGWTVAVDESSRVQLASPAFIEKNRTYDIRWSEADRWERYRVLDVAPNGWVLATGGASTERQYLNVTRAVSIIRVP